MFRRRNDELVVPVVLRREDEGRRVTECGVETFAAVVMDVQGGIIADATILLDVRVRRVQIVVVLKRTPHFWGAFFAS